VQGRESECVRQSKGVCVCVYVNQSMCVHEREREREREKDRKTDRKTDRQTERQTDRVRHFCGQ
jgi:hypothetical protein